jgi:hypothetical protein
MTNTPTTTNDTPPATTPPGEANISYTQWVTGTIKASKWYIGDGGFIAQAMQADTLEEATKTGAMISGRDRAGERFRFLNATFADSDLEGIIPLFAVCDVIDPVTGSVEKLSCGGGRVVATLFRACEKEWFPFEAVFQQVDMGDGKKALNLVLAPEQVRSTAKK